MTYDEKDLSQQSMPQRTSISNSSGKTYPVIGAGIVVLSPKIPLSNTLLVPSLSHKLLFVSQITKNCVV